MPLVGDSMHRDLRACAGAMAPVFGNTFRGDILKKRWQVSRNPRSLTPAHPHRRTGALGTGQAPGRPRGVARSAADLRPLALVLLRVI